MTEKLPYSYHTFMYPFSYQGKLVVNEELWKKDPVPDKKEVNRESKAEKDKKDKKDILLYNEYQYFFPQARKIIFNSDPEDSERLVSEHYCFEEVHLKKDNFYNIKILDEKDEPKEYNLVLNEIRLSIYPRFEIGIVTFETEYWPVSDTYSFSDVLNINDFGRRLFPPCINEKLNSILTADEISIHINNEQKYSVQFNRGIYENEQEIEFIRQILGIEDEGQTKIKSVLDDRMFVACLVRDDNIAGTPFLKNLFRDIEDDEQKDAEKIYQFVFIDNTKGGCSCQSRRMLNQELRTHIYDRWVNCGTFHGITEYSFVCATGEKDYLENIVINPFLTSYVDMAKMALAQRAALTKMENEIPEIPNDEVSESELEKIRSIWKDYILLQSKLCLPEVTFQQQGVEIYQMLKEFLKINTMNSNMDEKLDNLHNIAELEYKRSEQESDDKINDILNLMTFAGLTLALISMSQDFFFGINSLENGNAANGMIGIVILLTSGLLMFMTLSNRILSKTVNDRKENKMEEKHDEKDAKKVVVRITKIVYFMLFISIVPKLVVSIMKFLEIIKHFMEFLNN